MINAAKQEVERKQMLQDADQVLKDLEKWRQKRQQVQAERQQSNQIDSQDDAEDSESRQLRTDARLQNAMDAYENNMSMHKNIQDANVQHNTAKVQSIQQKDIVRDQINIYLEQTNHTLAYIQTEFGKEAGARKADAAPSSDGPLGDKSSQISQKQHLNVEEIQKEMFTKKQSIIDNFAKFEDDINRFDAELSSMINPVVGGSNRSGSGSGSGSGSMGTLKPQKTELDIDKLLADLKKQGEEALNDRQQEMKDGSGLQQKD